MTGKIRQRDNANVAIVSSASLSGKIPYSGGGLPVRSRMAPTNSRIACWPFLTEYKLH